MRENFLVLLYLSTTASTVHLPRYIAHKALLRNGMQGNTMETVEQVMKSDVKGMEIDIQLSKDGVLFLYHGNTLEEETNGTGIPENHTWQELQQLRTRSGNFRLPSLEKVFQRVGSKKWISLDVKTTRLYNGELVRELVRLLRKYLLQETVSVDSFNPFFLFSLRLAAPEIRRGYAFVGKQTIAVGEERQSHFDEIPWMLRQPFINQLIIGIICPTILVPRWSVQPAHIRQYMQQGYPIVCWTVDNVDTAKELFAIGVSGICTNCPLELIQKSATPPHAPK